MIRLAAAVASALVVSMAFHPVNAGFLAWIGLTPLLVLASADRGRGFLLECFAFGFTLLTAGCWWIYDLTFIGGFLTAAIIGVLFFLPFGFALRCVLRQGRVPLIAAAPVVWIAFDWLRSFVLSGFPWLFLAHTQWSSPEIIRVSAWTGAYGLTFTIVAVNAVAAVLLMRRLAFVEDPRPCGRAWWLVPFAAVAILLAASITGAPGIGGERLRVAVVQGNVPQYIKHDTGASEHPTQTTILKRHLLLTRQAVAEAQSRWGAPPDLVIWSEAVLTVRPDLEEWVYPMIARIAQAPTMLGAMVTEVSGEDRTRTTNSVLLLNEVGKLTDRYDKIHPVPGSEFIPYRDWFPRDTLAWIEETIAGISGWRPNLSPGTRLVPLEIPGSSVRAGVLICYEVIYPKLSRDLVRGGADVLVNITNYGWFKESAQLDQALAITVFRAVETGTPVVVAANTGISALIDASGRIVSTLSSGGLRKSVEGVLLAEIEVGDSGGGNGTTQTAIGDWPAVACTLLTGLLLLLSIPGSVARRKVAS
jgi:apolipoprotein N-acyltransferase